MKTSTLFQISLSRQVGQSSDRTCVYKNPSTHRSSVLLRYRYVPALVICLQFIFCKSYVPGGDPAAWYRAPACAPLPEVNLSGKKICIDPGHGGGWSGSIGKGGTRESAVNFAVACELKALLEDRGAQVYLTRGADTLDRPPAGGDARKELEKRCTFRDSVVPDLFLSIHHNGTRDGTLEKNQPEVYYALEDDGASLDAALFIGAELSALGLGRCIVQPGNYRILRSPAVPSVLGEASYLSNPHMEKLLNDSTARAQEVAAYFRGIVRWMALGVPSAGTVTIDIPGSTASVIITSDEMIDTGATVLSVDGAALRTVVENRVLTAALPYMLANGNHELHCSVVNVNGNGTVVKHVPFTVDHPASQISCTVQSRSAAALPVLRAVVTDARGMAVGDGKPVILDCRDTAFTRGGVAVFYPVPVKLRRTATVSCGAVSVKTVLPAGNERSGAADYFIVSEDMRYRVASALITTGRRIFTTDENGVVSLPVAGHDAGSGVMTVHADGFIDSVIEIIPEKERCTVGMKPWYGGILFGKTIMIDPEFGGLQSGGFDMNGLPLSTATGKIGTAAAGVIRRRGGTVRLTREGNRTIDSTERIMAAAVMKAHLYFTIRADCAAAQPYVACFPGSSRGQVLAASVAARWKVLSGAPLEVRHLPEYILQQTECPAVMIALPAGSTTVQTLLHHSALIAECITGGCADYFSDSIVVEN